MLRRFAFMCAAAKSVVELFVRSSETTAREKEVMKAVQDPELVAAMMGNVKVSAPGVTKMMQTRRKGLKMRAKPKDQG